MNNDSTSKDANDLQSQGLAFTLSNEAYGIDVLHVQEVLRSPEIAPVPGSPSHVLGLCGLYDGIGTGSYLNESKATDTCVREACNMPKLRPLLGRLLCWFGFHDFRVINRAFEFGAGGGIEKVECRRCGATMTRRT